MAKLCSICLETVRRPANLDLNCECKYYVHYKCFNEWWKDNNTCIICLRNNNKGNCKLIDSHSFSEKEALKVLKACYLSPPLLSLLGYVGKQAMESGINLLCGSLSGIKERNRGER